VSRPLRYVIEVAEALDRLGNALAGGDARLTISSDAWRSECRGGKWGKIARPVIDWCAYAIAGQRNHCRNSDAFDTALTATIVEVASARPVIPPK
jgi:hypothetical protein